MSIDSTQRARHHSSFRLRPEPDEPVPGQPDKVRWCGKVQRVVDGEAYDFCGWPELLEHLLAHVFPAQAGADLEPEPPQSDQ